jgi:hypothetical protein
MLNNLVDKIALLSFQETRKHLYNTCHEQLVRSDNNQIN